MGKRIKFWGGFGQLVALCSCLGLSVVLEGCASDGARDEASTAQAEIEKPVTIEIVPQYDTDPTKAIDTTHLPTKTIQTPWGPRQIPDQSKNPELKKYYESVNAYQKNGASHQVAMKAFYRSQRIIYTQQNDILRQGCTLVQRQCEFSNYYYTKDCGKKHQLGSYTLSHCEKANLQEVQRYAIGTIKCDFNDRLIDYYSPRPENIKDQINADLEFQCRVWRGETDWEIKSQSMNPAQQFADPLPHILKPTKE